MDHKYRNQNFARIFELIDTFKRIVNPGMLLLFVAITTICIANSPLRASYESLWTLDFFIGFGNFNLLSHHGHPLSLLQVINDGLMTVFFFTVGLEIKREILVGELSSIRQALLPIFAAIGGMIVPVLTFATIGHLQNFSPAEMKGMAIPMATDIAFSLGILAMLGKRVPLSLKIFLLALAIVDDIGGIVIIAIVYSSFSLTSLIYLGISLLLFGLLLIGNKLRVNNKLFYFFIGIGVWYLFLQSGIHPTIAGVLVAFTVPARPYLDVKKFTEGLHHDLSVIESTIPKKGQESIVLTNTQVRYLTRIEAASDHVISPLQHLEDNLHDIVNYIIMPLFAFANAGVVFDFANFQVFHGVTFAVVISLIFGKMTGIFLFSWITIRLRITRKPAGISWSNMAGLSLLGGVGFTVALFLSGLSYSIGSTTLNNAKLGIIMGSVIAGLGGFLILKFTLKKKNAHEPGYQEEHHQPQHEN